MKSAAGVVIIIPTYNEAANIKTVIKAVFSSVPEASILVVDDNSPDNTATIVKSLAAENPRLRLLFRQKKEGLGKAYIHAFRELAKDPACSWIVTMDADLSHDPAYLPKMLEEVPAANLVIGSRYNGHGGTRGWELWRRILSRGGNLYSHFVTGMPVYDCTAGFMLIDKKLLSNETLRRLDLSGYAFLIELKYRLWQTGAKIKEIPILFKNRLGGESKLSNHIILEGLLAPWRMRLKKYAK